MEPFKYHVYVCIQVKMEGVPSCTAKGSGKVWEALKSEIEQAGLKDEVQVTGCDCLGLCGKGPNMVVYPEGVWYSGVSPEDVPEIVSTHFKEGKAVERLALKDALSLKQDIQNHDRMVQAVQTAMDEAGFIPMKFNDLFRGFQESRVALTAGELNLFNAVGQGATAEEVAEKIGADIRGTEMLLNALAAIEMLMKKDRVFYNTPVTSRFLTQGSPDDSRGALMHIVHLWPRWSTLTQAVKKGSAVDYQKIDERSEERNRAFIAAMHKNAAFRAPQIVGVLDLAKVNKVLDLGGGSGAYAMAFARSKPGMDVTVFDLPSVIPLTLEYLKKEGLADKVYTIKGDMTKDDLGNGYDLVLISAICHMFSPDENMDLFNRILNALNPGGQIVIQDFILSDDKTSPRMAALFALNMLVNTRGGSSYSGKEYIDWLTSTGFKEAREVSLPGPTNLIIGAKP